MFAIKRPGPTFHDRTLFSPNCQLGLKGEENRRNGRKSVLERLLKTVDKIGGINLHTGGGKFIYPRRRGARGTAIRYFDMARVQRGTA